jgi:uncharacterized protein YciI
MANTYLVTYRYGRDMLERRTPHRPEHLARIQQAADEGWIVFGGSFADPLDGAVLVFEADSEADVLSWAGADPYAKAGLLRGVEVRQLNVAIRPKA